LLRLLLQFQAIEALCRVIRGVSHCAANISSANFYVLALREIYNSV
jgi:hypothetical protein